MSLLHDILLETDKVQVKIGSFPKLNTKLQARSTGGLRSLYNLTGGLGNKYQEVTSFLIIQEGVITALKANELLKYADKELLKARDAKDKSAAYKSGLCFALVAVYANDVALQLNAYKQLSILTDGKHYFEDEVIHARCAGYLKPIALSCSYAPYKQLTWTWAIKSEQGTAAVDKFETDRHELIRGKAQTLSIAQAFLLLGMRDFPGIELTDLYESHDYCVSSLKKYAQIDLRDASEHPLIENFKQARGVLEHYINLKNFYCTDDFKILEKKLKETEKMELSNEAAFLEANGLLQNLDAKIRAVTDKLVKDLNHGIDIYERPYIDHSMIQGRLGDIAAAGGWNNSRPAQFAVQGRLDTQAKAYWRIFVAKLNPLFASARVLSSQEVVPENAEKINLLGTQIEHALSILAAIKGSAVDESAVVTSITNDIETMHTQLHDSLNLIRNKITTHDQSIKDTVKQIIELNKKAAKEGVSDSEIANPNSTIVRCNSMSTEIKKHASWLEHLDPRSKSVAESEFKKNILSQATTESVLAALCVELEKVERNMLQTALKNLLGARKYNPAISLKDTLAAYFRSHKEQDLQELVISFVGEIKGLIKEQFDERVNISGKDLVQATIYMTFELAVQHLTEHNTKLAAKSEQLTHEINNKLQIAIEPLLTRYKEADHTLTSLLREKNSLDFSWKKNVLALFECQRLLEDDYKKLEGLFPSEDQSYIKPAVRTLVTNLQKVHLEFNQSVSQMNKEIGDTALDTLKYLVLKNSIKQEKALYLAQGKHHQERYDSLQRLGEKYEQLEGKNTDTRFSELLKAVADEKIKTSASHRKVGFWGRLKPCRLELMYSKIIDGSEKLATIAPNLLWKQADLNLDSMKYSALKSRILQEIKLYRSKGSHHQERESSLQLLEAKIACLDADESNQENRFAELLAAVRNEAIETKSSQKRIGFFGSLKECRLEKVYAQIIADAVVLDGSAADPASEDALLNATM